MEQVHHRINYYKEARKIAVLTKTHTSPDVPNNSYVTTMNTESFLHDIVTLFVKSPTVEGGPDWCVDPCSCNENERSSKSTVAKCGNELLHCITSIIPSCI